MFAAPFPGVVRAPHPGAAGAVKVTGLSATCVAGGVAEGTDVEARAGVCTRRKASAGAVPSSSFTVSGLDLVAVGVGLAEDLSHGLL